MHYQLVIQFAVDADDEERLARLIEIEGRMDRAADAETVEVDGFDFGAGEMNIFAYTGDPKAAIEALRTHIPPDESWRAAYRGVDDEDYIVLFPPGLDAFEVA